MNYKRIVFFICLTPYPLFLIPVFVGCENNMSTINLISTKDKTPLEVEVDARIVYTDSAKTKFVLTAPRIENYGGPDPYSECTKGIKIDFYDDSGRVNGHIEARYALRHENSKLMGC
jgi:hypothetical protein